MLGVVLILLSELDFSTPKAEESVQTGDYAQYVSTLNDELTNVISSIDGVGDCKVMITLKIQKRMFTQKTAKLLLQTVLILKIMNMLFITVKTEILRFC